MFRALRPLFWDDTAVLRTVHRHHVRLLKRTGAFVRRAARSSIRKSKNVAPPGKPPHSHAGQLRDLIVFAVDERAMSVVIGPVPFDRGQGPGKGPRLLEGGGTVSVRRKSGTTRTMRYRGNPFMRPAGEKEMKNPKLLRG